MAGAILGEDTGRPIAPRERDQKHLRGDDLGQGSNSRSIQNSMHAADSSTSAPTVRFRLRDADGTLKLFLTVFVVVLSLGYAAGIFFVAHTTSMSPSGIDEEFTGSIHPETSGEMKFEKSAREMFILIHDHVLSLALVFFALGGVFYFSSLIPDRLKLFILIEPFVAIVTTFGGIALVRFVAVQFSWLVIVSGFSLFVCFATMVVLILAELWVTRKGAVERC